MAVREFWLENSQGTKYSLHNTNVFLHQPSGLGYSVDLNTLKVGESNVIVTEEYNLGSAQGEILFMGGRNDAYQNYFNFVQFLYYRPIMLHYRTPNTFGSYRCQVRVVDVQKGEVDSNDGFLHVPVSMYRQTLWYDDNENVIRMTTRYEEGKRYALNRPYHYGFLSTSNIQLTNGGVANAPLTIEIDGNATDPSFSIYDSNDEKYGAARILGTYDYVLVDSNDLTERISLAREGSQIPNAVNFQDLTVGDPRKVFVTFLKLKPGTSTMVFNLPDDFQGYVNIRWRNAYVTV